eukprot:TRINITY_DN45964_c0_g1_i1.p1 TRINITY_DN45964_c0_g1~~TRINITY_DN45964_c0_g1_i1.p1  ORF type:complete len:316 (+),score=110.72 TRINITY_DN45964_c0_g1_i1:68-1015(+)
MATFVRKPRAMIAVCIFLASTAQTMAASLRAAGPGTSPAEDTGALVAQAEGRKAAAMAMEAKAAQAEAEAAAARAKAAADLTLAQNRGDLSSQVQAQLTDSAKRAAMYARTAAQYAKKAEKELAEIQAVPEEAAKEAAKAAVQQLQAQDKMNHAVVKMLDANLNPPPLPPVPEAAGKAAGPYVAAMSRAHEMQSTFEAKASGLRFEAEMLRTGAHNTAQQKAALEAAGDKALAKEVGSIQDDLLAKAAAKETAAAEVSSEAQHIELTLPKYAAAASQAVARATILGQQKWMPPPTGGLAVAASPAASVGPAPAAS